MCGYAHRQESAHGPLTAAGAWPQYPTWSGAGKPGVGTYLAASRRAGCRQVPGQPEASLVVCLLCLITQQLFNYASCMPGFIAL